MSSAKEHRIGETLIRVDGDLLLLRPVGVMTMAEATLLIELADQVRAEHGHICFLVDLERAGLIPADTRRHMVAYGARHPPLALALYNVGPIARGVNALLFAAMNLLGKKRQNAQQFSTEAAARAWLDAERKRVLTPS